MTIDIEDDDANNVLEDIVDKFIII